MMRKEFTPADAFTFILWACLLTLAFVLIAGCGKHSSTAPDTQTQSAAPSPLTTPAWYHGPEHHNIPVLLPDGEGGFVCETKPRPYDEGGATVWTLDHYVIIGPQGCPDVPID